MVVIMPWLSAGSLAQYATPARTILPAVLVSNRIRLGRGDTNEADKSCGDTRNENFGDSTS